MILIVVLKRQPFGVTACMSLDGALAKWAARLDIRDDPTDLVARGNPRTGDLLSLGTRFLPSLGEAMNMLKKISLRFRVTAIVGVLMGGLASSLGATEPGGEETTSYCEKDRCIFTTMCSPTNGEKTGCAYNTSPIGTCKTYECDET